jgi:hypothetical protein
VIQLAAKTVWAGVIVFSGAHLDANHAHSPPSHATRSQRRLSTHTTYVTYHDHNSCSFLVVLRASAPPRTTPRSTQPQSSGKPIAMTDTNGDQLNQGLNIEFLFGLACPALPQRQAGQHQPGQRAQQA